MFPSPQLVQIPEGTRDVMLTCNLTQCMWMVQLKNRDYTVVMSPYSIPILHQENEGNYSLIQETNTGQQYTTAHMYIHVQLNPASQPSSSLLIPIVIVVVVIIAIVIAFVVIALIFIIIFLKKKKSSSATDTNESPRKLIPLTTNKSDSTKRDVPSPSTLMVSESNVAFENLSDIQL